MYFMNADGTIKTQDDHTSIPTVQEPIKEEYHRRKRKVHEFNLFKRHPKCDCTNCWKNFGLTTIFYIIVIYLLYLIVKFIFSLIDKEEVKTLTTPVIN
jgi:hypothetical protein